MPTLEDALNATLAAEAVEASFVHVVDDIRITESAYVSVGDDVAWSHTQFEMTDDDGAGRERRGESIAHHDVLYTRVAGEEDWVARELPRPALGPLALLTVLFGADPQRPVPAGHESIDVEFLASRAAERVPEGLRQTLADLISARPEAGVEAFPEVSTARLRVHDDPLSIAEMTITLQRGEERETFALEIRPAAPRTVPIPPRGESSPHP